MTRITILPVPTTSGKPSYFAVAGDKQSFGNSAGEALDALTEQLAEEQGSTLVIVQHWQPDAFFGMVERQQLEDLMSRWRLARDQNQSLSAAEQRALEALIEAELHASAARTEAMLYELTQ
ncbi:MAG: hypothetical protein DCC55_39750 [Chloroflexi bacterium]|nr:MAG: hypothetical protein DCC55_39750 [Chloroflexota bacterium]